MAIAAAAGRIAATLVAMVHTRLELAAVEVQQEAQRLLGYVAWLLLAVFLAAGAFLLAALFVILLFWDSYRLHAVAAMAALFALAGAAIVMKVRASFDARPPLLSATLAELRNDVAFVTGAGEASEP
ncbi:MAG: phage holin family protein [Massilia sp.]